MIFWLGCALSLSACSLQELASGLPYPAVVPANKWEYHWGEPSGQLDDQHPQANWQPLATPLNPPGRQGNHWLWLRLKLPYVHSYDSLYLRGIDEQFVVYAKGYEIYHFGELPPQSRYYPGFPWHMIPLQPQYSKDYLYFRIYSSGRHIGIFGEPRIASSGAHLQVMVLQDLEHVVVGCLMIFIGLLVCLLFLNQPLQGTRLLCLFAVTIGLYIICRTEIKQLYLYAPVAWKWLEYLSLFTAVPALCFYLNRMFNSPYLQLWNRLIGVLAIEAAGSLALAALGVVSLPLLAMPFLLLTLANMLLGLYILGRSFRQHGRNAWLILLGISCLCLFTGTDILVSLKWLPWMHPVSHWGMLILLVTMVLLTKNQVEEVYHARKVAEEANRAKSEFLTNISHEIRTPLNAILGFTDLLAKELKQNPKAAEYLQIISTAGQTLLLLINDLLDLSKIEAQRMHLQPTPVQIRQLLEEIHQLFRLGMQEKGLSWELQLDENLPRTVEIDGVRLRQILLNLVGNALKFTAQGGVTLSVSCHERDASHSIDLNFRVQDSGIGIPPQALEQIFEPFYQVESHSQRRFGGTGLGLAITQRLVALMGSRLEVESQLQQGTCFCFELKEIPYHAESVTLEQELPWFEVASQDKAVRSLNLSVSRRQPLLQQLLELQQNKSINRIQKFADELLEIGAQLENARLLQFGQELKQAVQVFDIGQINALLDQLRQALN